MEEIIFSDHNNFNYQKERLIKGGPSHLQVICDFDRTLTTNFIHGRKAPSLVAALRDGNYLDNDYSSKAQALYDYYHPLEMDPGLSLETKKSLMAEWYRRHFELLIGSGLSQEKIADAIDNQLANLREGVSEFLQILEKNNIPLLIFSASGLGVSGLKYFFSRRGLLADNIYFLANEFIWDENNRAVGVREPIIHVFNKDETMLTAFGVGNLVKDRANILLLGDSLGDAGMAHGYAFKSLLKIAFLNDKIRESLPAYRENYHALILNDGNFNLPLSIIKEITSQED
jgi:HAD superfamily hydrolase (TIGR01544 family)